ncbi:MAG TPA: HlyD family efflux transporter periplasmic adaptor subunit [Gemmatimonadales bacterium]|nr:HlyD family efflux transporter periplasmic adaptor subunit [Gemmatimonadales bacterium]
MRSLSCWLLLSAIVACGSDDSDEVIATGTIEMIEIDVAPQVPARVVTVRVEEGQLVEPGDTLATLLQATTRADVTAHEARVRAAEAALREARAGARPGEIDQAEAELRQAEAELVRAERDLKRLQPLVEAGAESPQRLDAATAAAATAAARRDVVREEVQLLREGTRPERIARARAELATARAELAAARAVAGDLILTAPVRGTVLSRNAEPGEMLASGESVLTLGESGAIYTRVYVPTRQLPLVRQGQAATAYLDGFPDREFRGTVVAISTRAEFTPRIALTEKERANLVFGVKVSLHDTTGMLKAGLPATVRIHSGGSR